MAKPTTVPRWADTPTTLRTEPSEALKDTGVAVGVKWPAQYLNWLHGLAGDWLTWLDDVGFDPAAASVSIATPVSIANNSETSLAFDTEDHDVGGCWEIGHPTYFAAPATGYYTVGLYVEFEQAAVTNELQYIRLKNEDTSATLAKVTERTTVQTSNALYCACQVYLTSGTKVSAKVYQKNGSSSAVNVAAGAFSFLRVA